MQFSQILALAAVALASFLINLPLGCLRSRQRKMSFKWFLYIHMSIPVIYLMRMNAGIGPWAIPFFMASAVAGQVVGGRIKVKAQ